MTLGKLLSFFMLLFPLLLFVLIVGLVGVVSVAEHNGKLVGDLEIGHQSIILTQMIKRIFFFFFLSEHCEAA